MSIANYGNHPTRYSGMPDNQFYANFRASRWQYLSNDARLAVLQEAVNRSAAAHGEVGSCRVRWGYDLSSGTYAQQGGDYITFNADRFMQGADTDFRGRPLADAGMQALEAGLHEDEHAYQNQIIADVIDAPDPELEREYKANDVVAVPMPDGQYGSSYLQSDHVDYYMYYFQSTERDAFRNSQKRTREIMQQQIALIQQDMNSELGSSLPVAANASQDMNAFYEYADHLSYSGYYAKYKAAANHYAYPEFEQDLNTSLTNIYYNEHQPLVDESMQESVASAMEASYDPRQHIDFSHGTGAQASMAADPLYEADYAYEAPDAGAAPPDYTEETDQSADAAPSYTADVSYDAAPAYTADVSSTPSVGYDSSGSESSGSSYSSSSDMSYDM